MTYLKLGLVARQDLGDIVYGVPLENRFEKTYMYMEQFIDIVVE